MKQNVKTGIGIAILGIMALGAFTTLRSRGSQASPAPEREFTVHAKRFEYTPNILHVNKGDRVTIHLVSEDVHHGMYIDGYEHQTSATPGRSGPKKPSARAFENGSGVVRYRV